MMLFHNERVYHHPLPLSGIGTDWKLQWQKYGKQGAHSACFIRIKLCASESGYMRCNTGCSCLPSSIFSSSFAFCSYAKIALYLFSQWALFFTFCVLCETMWLLLHICKICWALILDPVPNLLEKALSEVQFILLEWPCGVHRMCLLWDILHLLFCHISWR